MRKLAGLFALLLLAGCGGINIPGPQPSPQPTPTPSGSPTPAPTPSPGGGITSLRVSPDDPHCLLKNGKPWQIAAYGGVVPAIPSHDWRADIDLCASQGCDYLRLWAYLSGSTVEWPWLKVGGKWDLRQPNLKYWQTLDEIGTLANAHGIVVELMAVDRGGGGGNSGDWKLSPWNPANNVNGLGGEMSEGGAGTVEFYAAGLKPGSKTGELLELLFTWYAESAKRHPNFIVEIENENRSDDANQGADWARRWAGVVKRVAPGVLTAYNSLNLEALAKSYAIKDLDIINVHFGNEGSPVTVERYCRDNWSRGKPVNVDEFLNGETNPAVTLETVEAITKTGCHFHIEDAAAGAKPEVAAKQMRNLIAQASPIQCQAGPQGEGPGCQKEGQRGQSILYVNRKGARVCTGNTDCTKWMAQGKIKKGDEFTLDSTALEGIQRPIPMGCGDCTENHTIWKTTTGGALKADGPCGVRFNALTSGTVSSCPTGGPGKCVTKAIKVQ